MTIKFWIKEIWLIVIISILTNIILQWIYIYYNNSIKNRKWDIEQNTTIATKNNNIVVTVINDARCLECNTAEAVAWLRQAPFLKNAKFDLKDFSDKGVSELITKKWIKTLPAILFNTNNIDNTMDKYLSKIDDNTYSLNIWAKFDPFAKRSNKWFLILNKEILSNIIKDSYVKWNKKAKITWLEYSDLECPYCAKQHNSTLEKNLFLKYDKNINKIFNHFPLDIHKNAQKWWELLECVSEQKETDWFYLTLDKSYAKYNNNNFSLDGLKEIVIKELWVNKSKLETCLNENKYSEKVKKQMEMWINLFNITWTPWNILINNETGEFQVFSGAYPQEYFEQTIDKMLK